MTRQNILFFIFVFSCFLCISCQDVVKNYYADGNLESVVPCKDGKLNGVAVWYYSHGKKCLEITYKDGLKNGEMTRFYRNGQKETVEYYKNDSLNETSLKYNEKGVLISEIAYRDGKKNGVIKQYYPDGSLFLRGNYVNDQYDGTWEYFDVEGFKVGEGLFDKGDGILTGYDDMENITRKVYYKNSIMYKEEMYSTKTKQIEKIVTYKDDRIADIQIIDNQTAKK